MNIVISGASTGIGRDLALKFASMGRPNILAISRNKRKLDSLKKICGNGYPNSMLIPLVFDITGGNYDKVIREFEAMRTIDILINNAAHIEKKEFTELSGKDLEMMFQVNFFGAVKLIKAALPFLGKIVKSHIVNISSMAGFQGSVKFKGMWGYGASKAALINLTESLATEFVDKNIGVNCLALGAVQTEMAQKAFPGYRAPLKSEEMADYISGFALKGHKFYNGQVLPVALSTP